MNENDLIVAVIQGDIEAVTKHLNEGGKPDREHFWSDTPLMISALQGNLKMTKLLLEGGANPNLAPEHCDFPLNIGN